MKICRNGGTKPLINFDGSDTLEEIASVMKCSVFQLNHLMDDLYVQDYDGETVTVQIHSKFLDELAESIEKAHSVGNMEEADTTNAARISPEGE